MYPAAFPAVRKLRPLQSLVLTQAISALGGCAPLESPCHLLAYLMQRLVRSGAVTHDCAPMRHMHEYTR